MDSRIETQPELPSRELYQQFLTSPEITETSGEKANPEILEEIEQEVKEIRDINQENGAKYPPISLPTFKTTKNTRVYLRDQDDLIIASDPVLRVVGRARQGPHIESPVTLFVDYLDKNGLSTLVSFDTIEGNRQEYSLATLKYEGQARSVLRGYTYSGVRLTSEMPQEDADVILKTLKVAHGIASANVIEKQEVGKPSGKLIF